MRKFILFGLLVTFACGLPVQAIEKPEILKGSYFTIFPGSMTKDSKPFLYTREWQDKRVAKFNIYDENLQLIKEFETLKFPELESKYSSQSRAYGAETVTPTSLNQNTTEPLEINGQSDGLTIERVQNYIFAMYGSGEISSLANGTPIVVRWYYDENAYGKKYPECYWMETDGKWFEFRQHYEPSGAYGPFGEWGPVEESVSTIQREPEYIYIIPENGGDDESYQLTTGIFGDDYYYIVPKYESMSFDVQEEYYDKPGWIYEKSWGNRYEICGIEVYDSSNKEVLSVKAPEGYLGSYDYYFFKMGDNNYFSMVGKEKATDEYCVLFYRLDSNNSVSFIAAAPSTKVTPRNPKRGEMVTVTLDSSIVKDSGLLNVISTSGQTLLSTKIAAGQSQINVDTSGLSQGMYVVTVSSQGGTKEAAKIIVR